MKARLTSLTLAAMLVVAVLQIPASDTQLVTEAAARAKATNKLGWAYISSAKPKKAFVNKKTIAPIGRYPKQKAVYRSYFRMSLAAAVGKDNVSYVRLRVPVSAPNACRKGGAPAVKVYLTKTITKQTTWRKQPKVIRALGAVKPKCGGKVLELDITKVAVGILNKGGRTLTLGLAAANEKTSAGFVKLSNAAQLLVKASAQPPVGGPDADPATNAPKAVAGAASSVGACAATTAATGAEFSGNVADADGGFLGLRVEWQKVGGTINKADSKMTYTEPNKAQKFAVTLPAGSFADGAYQWRVQGYDDFRGGPWTPWCQFTVATPYTAPAAPVQPAARAGQPPAPTGLTLNGTAACAVGPGRPTVAVGAVTATATVTDPDGDPTKALFQWIELDGTPAGEAELASAATETKTTTVPASALVPGTTYAWRVQPSDADGPGLSTPWCEYTVA